MIQFPPRAECNTNLDINLIYWVENDNNGYKGIDIATLQHGNTSEKVISQQNE